MTTALSTLGLSSPHHPSDTPPGGPQLIPLRPQQHKGENSLAATLRLGTPILGASACTHQKCEYGSSPVIFSHENPIVRNDGI